METNMQLTARTFDLLSSLFTASQPATALARSAQDLIKWLARERIDELSFTKCAELARGLAYPNENGVVIRDSIEKADRSLPYIKGAPLNLVISGSLGRMMAQDIEFCYIVSTVTSLAAIYGPTELTDLLSSMMLDAGDLSHGVHYSYKIQRQPINAVISKIVESIFINVVNAGHQMAGVPQELRHLHAHTVGHANLAGIVMCIQRTTNNVILVSENFVADVATWLFYHFHGRLEISVGNRILLEKKLGSAPQIVRMIVQKVCREADPCFLKPGSIELSVATGDGRYTTLLKSNDNAGTDTSKPRSHTRQALYYFEDSTVDITHRLPRARGLNRAERNYVFAVAKKILSWLLNIPLEPGPSWNFQLTFKARLDGGSGSFRLRDILNAHPSLLQNPHGRIQDHSEPPIFKGSVPEPPLSQSDDDDPSDRPDDVLLSPSGILGCFPAALDLLDIVQKRCTCPSCDRGDPLEDTKSGCLRYCAYLELFVVLAHGISESLGASDVSGLSNPQDVAGAVMILFFNLLRKELVDWGDWFTVVACTTAGIPLETVASRHRTSDTGATSLVAMQNGCFLAMAPWISFQRELSVKGCFTLEFFEGNLNGVSEDLALLRSERGMESDGVGASTETLSSEDFLNVDDSETEINTAIFRVGSNAYRLITFVKCASHFRVIDPVDAIQGLFRATFMTCPHATSAIVPDDVTPRDKLCVFRFEDILGDWDRILGGAEAIQSTYVLTSRLKFNVVLSLCTLGSVVRDVASCCLSCAARAVRGTLDRSPFRLIQTRALSHPRILN